MVRLDRGCRVINSYIRSIMKLVDLKFKYLMSVIVSVRHVLVTVDKQCGEKPNFHSLRSVVLQLIQYTLYYSISG